MRNIRIGNRKNLIVIILSVILYLYKFKFENTNNLVEIDYSKVTK